MPDTRVCWTIDTDRKMTIEINKIDTPEMNINEADTPDQVSSDVLEIDNLKNCAFTIHVGPLVKTECIERVENKNVFLLCSFRKKVKSNISLFKILEFQVANAP